MRYLPVLLAAAVLPAHPVFAQERGGGGAGGDIVVVGLGAGYLPDHEGSNDYRLMPVPGAIGRLGGFSFLYVGNRLSVDLVRDGESDWDFQLGPAVLVGLNRTSVKAVRDRRIRALGKVDTPIELGGYAGIARWGVVTSAYDRLSFTVTWRRDVAGGHDGTIVTPTISYMTPLSTKAMVTLVASANHADGRYARSYYSVTPAQSAASGLPAHVARGGWKDWTLGAAGNVALTGDLTGGLSLVGGVAYSRMLNDFADSPVVRVAGSRDQWMAGLGLAYTF